MVTYSLVEGNNEKGNSDCEQVEDEDVSFHGLDSSKVVEHLEENQKFGQSEDLCLLAVFHAVRVHDGTSHSDGLRQESHDHVQSKNN